MYSDQDPTKRAQFGTLARLISCFVTESLVPALYWPISHKNGTAGFAVILTSDVSQHNDLIDKILCIIPLHHPPIFKGEGHTPFGKRLGLLDPLDMIPLAFTIEGKSGSEADDLTIKSALLDVFQSIVGVQLDKDVIHIVDDPLIIWRKYAHSRNLDENIETGIADELANSVKWQTYSYEDPPQAPLYTSSSIDWEQSIVESHPTHPLYKIRKSVPPLPTYAPGEYDFLRPNLRFVSILREEMKITYDFESLVSPLLEAAAARAGRPFDVECARIVIPVHELQIHHILDKVATAIIYPEEFSIPLLAQQSLRSVVIPEGFRGLQLKLALGVKITSAIRTISPESAYLGPRFSLQVVPSLTMDHNIITVAKELASVVHSNPDGDIAKHCGVLVREYHEDRCEERGERMIVCTSLVESGHAGTDGRTPSVIRVFELNTERKRLQWLEKFISIFLKAFLPPMLFNGVAFEAHPQNCLARFDLQTKELKGFVIRDFGGLRVHLPTLKATTGVDMDFVLPGHSIIADTLDDVYTRMYHTIVHNHFQQLIRVLQLHYNGLGWNVVREQLRKNIPIDHPLHDAWLSPSHKTLSGKCYLRMRMSSMYRFHLHGPFPNLLHYTGDGSGTLVCHFIAACIVLLSAHYTAPNLLCLMKSIERPVPRLRQKTHSDGGSDPRSPSPIDPVIQSLWQIIQFGAEDKIYSAAPDWSLVPSTPALWLRLFLQMAAAKMPDFENSHACPRERAAFAVMSRLISCLVTEQILPATYIPSDFSDSVISGYMMLSNSSELSSGHIFVVVPLHHAPVFVDDFHQGFGQLVGLVDPLDMLPFVFELTDAVFGDKNESYSHSVASTFSSLWAYITRGRICRIEDPIELWRKFVLIYPVDYSLCNEIEMELKSSFFSQIMAFENPPLCPTLQSSSIIWEQSLVTGHPIHPMHRARLFDSENLEYDWYHPLIRFVGVPRADLELKGDFDQATRRLASKAAANAGRVLQDDSTLIYMPVHELQFENIRSRVGSLKTLDPEINFRAQAQSSIRTLEIPGFPDMAFKLSIGVRISSALRTISHFTADFGPRFSRDIISKLAMDPEILHVEAENCSAVYRTPDPDVAKHFTAVVREKYRPPNGQVVIVVAALLDMGHAGLDRDISVVEHVFRLDSEKKKEAFLDRYIHLACQALIPPLIKNGVAFEAHPQNVLARFDIDRRELQGFVVRDLGGLRIHPPTLRESTRVDFQFLDGHVVATETLEEIFPKFYHTFVHNHLQRLIRLLGMHYNGRGWEMVRKYMAEVIPVEHPAWGLWMDPGCRTVNSKCLMRMRLCDSYRDMVYAQIPNLIQYEVI